MGLLVTLVSLAGCGGGYSTAKAEQVCEQERVSKDFCMTDDSIDDCIACHQECGDACRAEAKCPESYSCE